MEHMSVLLLTVVIAMGMVTSVTPLPSDGAANTDLEQPLLPDGAANTDLEQPLLPDGAANTDLEQPLLPDGAANTDIETGSATSQLTPSNAIVQYSGGAISPHCSDQAANTDLEMGSATSQPYCCDLTASEAGSNCVSFSSFLLSTSALVYSVVNSVESGSNQVPDVYYWTHFALALFSWVFAFSLPSIAAPTLCNYIAVFMGALCHYADYSVTVSSSMKQHSPSGLRFGFQIADKIAFFFVLIFSLIKMFRRR